jgi:hypothetical protein
MYGFKYGQNPEEQFCVQIICTNASYALTLLELRLLSTREVLQNLVHPWSPYATEH